jgi:hypothetical protein
MSALVLRFDSTRPRATRKAADRRSDSELIVMARHLEQLGDEPFARVLVDVIRQQVAYMETERKSGA